jgi:hypothetical protein
MDLRQDGVIWTGLIGSRAGTIRGLLWTRQLTFQFHNMMESSSVAAQLAAPQEGLNSMMLVSSCHGYTQHYIATELLLGRIQKKPWHHETTKQMEKPRIRSPAMRRVLWNLRHTPCHVNANRCECLKLTRIFPQSPESVWTLDNM